jgi:hypothetical protein
MLTTLVWPIYSENKRGIYLNSQKRLKHRRQNITLHSINDIIRDNKCIFTKLKPKFDFRIYAILSWLIICSLTKFPFWQWCHFKSKEIINSNNRSGRFVAEHFRYLLSFLHKILLAALLLPYPGDIIRFS